MVKLVYTYALGAYGAIRGGPSPLGGTMVEYFVYVIRSIQNNYLYKGMTNNLERRISEHNEGKCFATKKYLPFYLVFVQICENRKEARNLEKYLKSGTGREIIDERGSSPLGGTLN